MFTLKFTTDNAAFSDGQAREETVRILQLVIAKLRVGREGGFCTDKDGNCIGEWSLDYAESNAPNSEQDDMTSHQPPPVYSHFCQECETYWTRKLPGARTDREETRDFHMTCPTCQGKEQQPSRGESCAYCAKVFPGKGGLWQHQRVDGCIRQKEVQDNA